MELEHCRWLRPSGRKISSHADELLETIRCVGKNLGHGERDYHRVFAPEETVYFRERVPREIAGDKEAFLAAAPHHWASNSCLTEEQD